MKSDAYYAISPEPPSPPLVCSDCVHHFQYDGLGGDNG